MLPVLLLAVLIVGLVSPVFAVKGSYPGVNGKIAFTDIDPEHEHDYEIFVMDNDGSNIQQLTHNEVEDMYPCWSPDGTKIAFSSGDYPNPQIWVMDVDGMNQRKLTLPPDGYEDYDPAWSPDGSKIAYTRDDYGSSRGIFVIDADGPAGAGTQLINNAFHPSWSPDGSEIAYHYAGIIYVANANTGAYKRTLGDGTDPCWSPDGTKIVVVVGDDAIWVMNAADGSNRQQLTGGYGDDEPNWSPDGTRIVFNRYSIWIMDADGTNEDDLTPTLPDAWGPDYQRLSGTLGPVGGVVSPIDKLSVIAPYLALAVLAVISTVVSLRGRKD